MLQLFRTNNPLAVIPLALYAILLNLYGFISPNPIPDFEGGFFSKLLHQVIDPASTLSYGLAILLIVFQAVLVNKLVNGFKLTKNYSWLPAMFYVFVISILMAQPSLNPLLLGMTFFIIGFGEMFSIYKKRQEAAGNVFNIGFWFSIASLFYLSYASYLLLGLIGLAILGELKLKDVLILILGFITPFFLIETVYFWYDDLTRFWNTNMASGYGVFDLRGFDNWRAYPKLAASIILLLLALVNIQNLLAKTKIQTQKYIALLFWSIPVAALTLFFQAGIYPDNLIIICVPISVFLSKLIIRIRNKPVAEFVHAILLIIVLGYQYIDLILGATG